LLDDEFQWFEGGTPPDKNVVVIMFFCCRHSQVPEKHGQGGGDFLPLGCAALGQ